MTNEKLEQAFEVQSEVQAEKGIWQNEFHEFDVYNHTLEFVRHIKDIYPRDEMIVAGYLHDIGKPVVAKPRIVDGKLQEKAPGVPYHSFDDHEKVGEDMVKDMNSGLFIPYRLNQDKIARLVGTHYEPMKGIKAMRKANKFNDFLEAFNGLEKTLAESGLPKEEIMAMFLADKLAQGKFCTDKSELFAVRHLILGDGRYSLQDVYNMQKQAYGGKE